jgi:hypothetical protein
MPGGDGTGPLGRGAMTGRGMGVCAGAAPVGYGPGYGPGYGRGLGRRRGFGRCFVPCRIPVADDRGFLERQKQALQARLSLLNKQLEDLSGEDK